VRRERRGKGKNKKEGKKRGPPKLVHTSMSEILKIPLMQN